ncbi:MAG: tetratricopeptide repeat protein [Magnetococcales bacterium]|nr:tetratricopeptide repeat protein [Magnetococcales bacterium]
MAVPLHKSSANTAPKVKASMPSNYSEKPSQQPNSDEIINNAVFHHQNGDFETAFELYDSALNSDPTNVKLLYLCGLVHLDMGNFQKAVDLLSFAATLNPNNSLLHDSLSNALWGKGNIALAISCCNISLKLNPKSVETWYNKGCLLLEQKEEREAIAAFEEVIKLDPTHYKAYGKISESYSLCNEHVCENYYLKLFQYYTPEAIDVNFIDTRDIFFIDSSLALKIAKKKNRIPQTIHISSLQVCYYSGKFLEDHPQNLIHVPVKDLIPFFQTSRLSFPRGVEFNPEIPAEKANTKKICFIKAFVERIS